MEHNLKEVTILEKTRSECYISVLIGRHERTTGHNGAAINRHAHETPRCALSLALLRSFIFLCFFAAPLSSLASALLESVALLFSTTRPSTLPKVLYSPTRGYAPRTGETCAKVHVDNEGCISGNTCGNEQNACCDGWLVRHLLPSSLPSLSSLHRFSTPSFSCS